MTVNSKLTIDELISIRKMPRAKAMDFIAGFDLTDEERSAVEALMQPAEEIDPRADARNWVVVAFLLGASLRQIAREKGGVSPQSVYAMVERVLPDTKTRRSLRLRHALSYESLSEYKIKYFENVEMLRTLPILEAAQWLYDNTSLDVE